MKILIENATIVTLRESEPIIEQGYIYINKGVIASLGKGPPPPELELAEYVIDGRGRVVLPGFVIGVGDILEYVFRFYDVERCRLIEVLSKGEIQALLEVALTSLAMRGATSLVTITKEEHFKYLPRAVSTSWIRTRIVIEGVEHLDEALRHVQREVSEQDAIAKGIVSIGVRYDGCDASTLERIEASSSYAYVCKGDPLQIRKIIEERKLRRVILINPAQALDLRSVFTNGRIVKGHGVGFEDPTKLSPHLFLYEVYNKLGSYIETIEAAIKWNAQNFDIGIASIVEGVPADIVIYSYREPPSGPIPMSTNGLFKAIVLGELKVDTVIIGGDVVVDNGEPLMVGRATFKKAMNVVEELRSKK